MEPKDYVSRIRAVKRVNTVTVEGSYVLIEVNTAFKMKTLISTYTK